MNLFRTIRRLLLRETGFVAVAVLTLALGIGATVTIFTVVNGVLFESLPYPESERLLYLDHEAPGLDLPEMGVSRKLYLHYLDKSSTLEEVALRDDHQMTLTGEGEPERVQCSAVTPSFFRVLRVSPLFGRTFSEDEGKPGGPRTVVLSHGLWSRRFGGDSEIVGRTLQADSETYEIVGVMPPDFIDGDVEFYRPRQIDPNKVQLGAFNDGGIARHRPDVEIEEVRADLERLSAGLTDWFPDEPSAGILDRSGFRATVEPLLEARVGDLREILWVLMGTVGVILAIACGNVANLFLVRVEERSHELGVRSALGASRWRTIREILSEGMALSLLSGLIALVFARVGVLLLKQFGPESLPRLQEIAINGRVVAFAFGVTVLSGLGFGFLPALRGSTEKLLASLRDGTRSASSGKGRNRVRNVLVAGQVALGLVLLVGCGLLVRTLLELRQADPGFDPSSTLTFRVTLPEAEYEESGAVARFAELALARLQALPGVDSAGLASSLPMSGSSSGAGYAVEDRPPEDEGLPPVFMELHVSDGMLETLGARLLEGRWLTAADSQDRSGNLLVSRSIQQRFWPGESAVGRRIYPSRSEVEVGWYTVVGVVEDIFMRGLAEEPRDLVFKPLLGLPEAGHDMEGALSFAMRTSLPLETLVPVLRSEIWSLDRNVPVTQVRTMQNLVEESRAEVSFTVVILLIASAVALLLAAIGLYGVVSYVVSRRTHEFGIRLAMGADRGDVARMVLQGGLAVSGVGIAVGLVLAAGTTRFLESMLFGVSKYDPPTFTVVPLVLLLVSGLASWIPAMRASDVEPVRALRQD